MAKKATVTTKTAKPRKLRAWTKEDVRMLKALARGCRVGSGEMSPMSHQGKRPRESRATTASGVKVAQHPRGLTLTMAPEVVRRYTWFTS
jgi:hypothetical protein